MKFVVVVVGYTTTNTRLLTHTSDLRYEGRGWYVMDMHHTQFSEVHTYIQKIIIMRGARPIGSWS